MNLIGGSSVTRNRKYLASGMNNVNNPLRTDVMMCLSCQISEFNIILISRAPFAHYVYGTKRKPTTLTLISLPIGKSKCELKVYNHFFSC